MLFVSASNYKLELLYRLNYPTTAYSVYVGARLSAQVGICYVLDLICCHPCYMHHLVCGINLFHVVFVHFISLVHTYSGFMSFDTCQVILGLTMTSLLIPGLSIDLDIRHDP